jgi:hypothetical protein
MSKSLINQQLSAENLQKMFSYVQDKRECRLARRKSYHIVDDTPHIRVMIPRGETPLEQLLWIFNDTRHLDPSYTPSTICIIPANL